jgi:hypothetical protein
MAKAVDIYVIYPPGDMSVWELARRSLTELAALGGAGDADIRAHRRCRGYRLHTTAAQASVWMADEVQDELTGYEFMQWPIAGRHLLRPQLVDDQVSWLGPTTDTVIASIGDLCPAQCRRPLHGEP